MFRALGAFTYKFRKTIILTWLIAAVSLALFAVKLPGLLNGSGFEMDGEYAKVQDILQEDFGKAKSTMILLFESERVETDKPAYHSFVKQTLKQLENIDHLARVTSPLETKSHMKDRIAYATLSFNKGFDELKPAIEQIRDVLHDGENIKVSLTGGPVIAEDLNRASQEDLAKAETIGVPAALIILILAFGGLVAAGLPLLIGLISVVSTAGITYFFGLQMNLSVFLLNVIPMVGLALGIDFALLLVNRFREELENSPVKDAVITSIETAGRSIAFSGVCVFLGLSGMLFIQIDLFRTITLGGMTVVILSVLTALTFLPALLSVLGTKVNRLRLFKPNENKKSLWYRFARFVMKRPIIMLIAALIGLLAAMIPVNNLELTIPEAEALPEGDESRIAHETFVSAFGERNLQPVTMVVQSGEAIMTIEQLEQLEKLMSSVKENHIVQNINSIFTATNSTSPEKLHQLYERNKSRTKIQPAVESFISKSKKQTLLYVYLDADSTSENAKGWVRQFDTNQYGFKILLGGQTKFSQEIFDEIIDKIPYGLTVIFLSTYVILLLAFRSVLLPLKAILMNALSLSATFGLLVWLFQEGHLGDPTSIGLMIPVFIFALVFGLSMDYEVFLISRMQEYYEDTRDNDYAALMGLTTTSKIITSAAAIMIVVTGSFAFTQVAPVQQMGVGIALAIFLDATIVRMILVPSLMKLLGRWNWWVPSAFR